jgi:hypothetical protein
MPTPPPIDPREIITPDAFTVAPHLLGRPLARPARRAAAMMIDLILVALMIHAFGSVFLPAVGGVMLVRILKPSRTGGIMRQGAVFAIGFVAILLIVGSALDALRDEGDELDHAAGRAAIADAQAGVALAADSLRGAAAAADSLRDTSADADADADSTAATDTADFGRDDEDRADVVPAASDDDGDDERDEPRGVRRMLAAVADDLGIGFGWMALYFTAFVMLGKGQTPGKLVLGIRVIRLDGRPMSWWVSFERFGGYAASFSIGLLGFLQILWDRNRQGLHDKAVGTVVVRETS